MIRDEKGARLQQPIEYEWKPLYCQRCHWVGHNCDKPSKLTKEWKVKIKEQPQQGKVQTNVDTDGTIEAGDTSNAKSDEIWTMITNNSKGKGQGVANEDGTIQCHNGFGLLGILNDPGSGQNTNK
ncbi:unnamed protein product [Lathyrus sativus]|nr:unnamed protein product [Lathyrus sativus]